MKLGSLFDGEAGFPLSASLVGIKPVWASEIEPYPIAISHSRFPDMKHVGDVSLCNGAELEPVDIITFGSPCQDMSVAGKRNGMKHEDQGDEETTRSGLFFESARLIKEMKVATNGKHPRFAVWENVPGAFSSNGGRDFHAVLSTLAAIAQPGVSIPEPERDSKTNNLIWLASGCIVGDGWSIAWRTLDAQYWGVPQRRRRIYLVADFGSERAGEILFEPYRVRGDSTESGPAREGTPADAMGRADRGVGNVDGTDRADGVGRGVECLNPWDSQAQRLYSAEGIHPAVFANEGGGQDRHGVVLAVDGYNQNTSDTMGAIRAGKADQDHVGCVVYPDTARALTASYDSSPCDDRGQNVVVQPAVFHTLTSTNARCVESAQQPNCVAIHQNADGEIRPSDKAYTVNTNGNATGRNSPVICEPHPVIALQANGIDRALTAGCNGAGWRENEMYTLNTIDRHAVVYPETYQRQVGALCSTDYKWVQQQQVEQGKLIVEPAYFTRQRSDEFAQCEVASTESARQYKDATDIIVEHPRRYIVRRLMPLETTRLQGYPDWWHDLAPFDGDVAFWESVRETWARITGANYKPFADVKRLEKWYYGLRTDSAEYKVDGNSLAIPCAAYVIRRIADEVT